MSTEIIRQIGASADDGMINSIGTFGSGGTGIVFGAYTENYSVFARFLNLTIPKNATIDSATLSVRALGTDSSVPVSTRIYFNDIDDAVAPTSYAGYNALDVTTAYVDWSVPAFSLWTWYTTPDIKTVIQEIVNRAGWTSGNDMLALIKDNGTALYHMKQGYAYDQEAASSMKLTINYTSGKKVFGGTVTKIYGITPAKIYGV
jgi:type IV pilus assembly protein PilY1